MFEIYITLIFFFTTLYFIYKRYFYGDIIKGEWLEINRDISIKNGFNWDISGNSNIKILNFSNWRRYFFGATLFQKLGGEEGFVMNFGRTYGCHYTLDVYDEEMIPIHSIIDPDSLIFSPTGNPGHYPLDPDRGYIFFLRTCHTGMDTTPEVHRHRRIKEFRGISSIRDWKLSVTDESELEEYFQEKAISIKSAMIKRGYYLAEIHSSEEYLSFPSSVICHRTGVPTTLGDVIILLCTNKWKTMGMANHSVEVNSANKNLNWKPDDNGIISHLLIDNSDGDDMIQFYERTTNVSNKSNILPFQVMVFRRN